MIKKNLMIMAGTFVAVFITGGLLALTKNPILIMSIITVTAITMSYGSVFFTEYLNHKKEMNAREENTISTDTEKIFEQIQENSINDDDLHIKYDRSFTHVFNRSE